jgi:AraC-like DNA-binding protein
MHKAENYPKVYLYKRLVQAKEYIDVNFHLSLDLDTVSDQAYFSKFHFIRLFKKAYGSTPHQYLTAVLVAKAKQLLREGRPVTDVCFSIGFDSVSSFTGLFKRTTGMMPAVYQKAQQMRHADMERSPLTFIPHCFAGRFSLGH